jgi:hypothetical protein
VRRAFRIAVGYSPPVLEPARINEIVDQVATAHLTRENVDRVMSEPAIDSRGEEAVRITIVIKPGAVDRLKGDPVLDTLLQIQQRLRAAGEERFPIVGYATSDELDHSGDPES